jgi:hypothetical protein
MVILTRPPPMVPATGHPIARAATASDSVICAPRASEASSYIREEPYKRAGTVLLSGV